MLHVVLYLFWGLMLLSTIFKSYRDDHLSPHKVPGQIFKQFSSCALDVRPFLNN